MHTCIKLAFSRYDFLRNTMNHFTVGQRLPISQLNVDDTAPITLKFTRQSPIEMDISCLDAAGKLINDDYMVFYNQPTAPCGQIKLTNYESQPTVNKDAHSR